MFNLHCRPLTQEDRMGEEVTSSLKRMLETMKQEVDRSASNISTAKSSSAALSGTNTNYRKIGGKLDESRGLVQDLKKKDRADRLFVMGAFGVLLATVAFIVMQRSPQVVWIPGKLLIRELNYAKNRWFAPEEHDVHESFESFEPSPPAEPTAPVFAEYEHPLDHPIILEKNPDYHSDAETTVSEQSSKEAEEPVNKVQETEKDESTTQDESERENTKEKSRKRKHRKHSTSKRKKESSKNVEEAASRGVKEQEPVEVQAEPEPANQQESEVPKQESEVTQQEHIVQDSIQEREPVTQQQEIVKTEELEDVIGEAVTREPQIIEENQFVGSPTTQAEVVVPDFEPTPQENQEAIPIKPAEIAATFEPAAPTPEIRSEADPVVSVIETAKEVLETVNGEPSIETVTETVTETTTETETIVVPTEEASVVEPIVTLEQPETKATEPAAVESIAETTAVTQVKENADFIDTQASTESENPQEKTTESDTEIEDLSSDSSSRSSRSSHNEL